MGNSHELTKRQEIINQYLIAATTFYGVVTHRQFLLLFNRFNNEKLLKSELLKYSNKLNRKSDTYYVYTDIIVNDVVDAEILDYTYELQQGKKYYSPTKEELILYAKPNYYAKTPQVLDLQNFLVSEMKVNPLALNSLMYQLIWGIVIGKNMQAAFDKIEEFGIQFKNMSQAELFTALFTKVWNNTRVWANCGYTPIELRELFT